MFYEKNIAYHCNKIFALIIYGWNLFKTTNLHFYDVLIFILSKLAVLFRKSSANFNFITVKIFSATYISKL